MRKYKIIAIFAMLAVIATTVVFVGCKKEETHMVKNNVPENKQDKQQKYLQGTTTFFGANWQVPNNPETEDCYNNPQTCFDDVIIRPEKIDSYRDFVHMVTSSPDGLVKGFSDDVYREIMPEIESQILDELTSGIYYMHHIINERTGKECLLVSPSSDYSPEDIQISWMFRFIIEN